MRRPARRFGILVLALALVPGQFSTADAGVIPWLYDAVFGPVGHYGYGGYGYGGYAYRHPYAGSQISYSMPAAPAYRVSSNCGLTGCGPVGCATPAYSVGYRPMFAYPTYCSTGGCSTVLNGFSCSARSCGTCSAVASSSGACAAKTAWKSEEPKEAKTEWETEVITGETAVPTPAATDEAPRPQTFASEPADPSKAQPEVAVEKVVAGGGEVSGNGDTAGNGATAEGDPNWATTGKPVSEVAAEAASGDAVSEAAAVEAVAAEEAVGVATESAPGAAGFGEVQRGPEEDVNKIFNEPLQGVEPAIEGESAPTKAPLLEDGEAFPGADEVPAAEAPQALELEEQSSLKFHAPVKRIAFRAGFGRATVFRTSVVVNDEYVVPAAVALRLVSR